MDGAASAGGGGGFGACVHERDVSRRAGAADVLRVCGGDEAGSAEVQECAGGVVWAVRDRGRCKHWMPGLRTQIRCPRISLTCFGCTLYTLLLELAPNEFEMSSLLTLQPIAVALKPEQKQAALLFDKLLFIHDSDLTRGIPPEVALPVYVDDLAAQKTDWRKILSGIPRVRPGEPPNPHVMAATQLRVIAADAAAAGIPATPVFGSFSQFSNCFEDGKADAISAIMQNIAVVSDDLTWEHILEFRADAESLRKYRALRVWLADSLKATSTNHAADIVGVKLSEYEWALKKHGMKTVQGAITQILSTKDFLPAAVGVGVVSLTTAPIWGLAGGAGYLLASATAIIRQHKIDLEDTKRHNTPIAMIHEIKQLVRNPA